MWRGGWHEATLRHRGVRPGPQGKARAGLVCRVGLRELQPQGLTLNHWAYELYHFPLMKPGQLELSALGTGWGRHCPSVSALSVLPLPALSSSTVRVPQGAASQ